MVTLGTGKYCRGVGCSDVGPEFASRLLPESGSEEEPARYHLT